VICAFWKIKFSISKIKFSIWKIKFFLDLQNFHLQRQNMQNFLARFPSEITFWAHGHAYFVGAFLVYASLGHSFLSFLLVQKRKNPTPFLKWSLKKKKNRKHIKKVLRWFGANISDLESIFGWPNCGICCIPSYPLPAGHFRSFLRKWPKMSGGKGNLEYDIYANCTQPDPNVSYFCQKMDPGSICPL